MSGCPWKLAWRNPLGQDDIHIDCQKSAHLGGIMRDEEHQGRMRATLVSWQQGDRRGYEGQFAGWCSEPGCVLPRSHLGRCAK